MSERMVEIPQDTLDKLVGLWDFVWDGMETLETDAYSGKFVLLPVNDDQVLGDLAEAIDNDEWIINLVKERDRG